MARKGEDLLKDLDDLGVDEQPQQPSTSTSNTKKSSAGGTHSKKPSATSAPAPKKSFESRRGEEKKEDENLFGDIEKQLAAKPAASQGGSRPATPGRVSSSSTSAATATGPASKYTPMSSKEGSQRGSGEEARGAEEAEARAAEASAAGVGKDAGGAGGGGGGGGGWWGVFSGAASAARKQAETLAKTVQGNEEAQRWAGVVQGRLGDLSHLGDDLRARALPSFQALISHIAPPISAHERLQIHTTHDLVAYPSLDPLIYQTFARVMAQVEGGDLLVIQRGSESRSRTTSEPAGYKGGVLGSGGTGWTDGPWWREEGVRRDLGAVPGLKEGTKLCRVSAESYAREFFEKVGGVEAAAKRATDALSESNPVRSSDIFLAIQPISHQGEKELFAADAREGKEDEKSGVVEPVAKEGEDGDEDLVTFALYLHDPIHGLSFSALSQPLPAKWTRWLDAAQSTTSPSPLPESIQEIISSGGVDPREWVAEWMEETLGLVVGVVAQRYVARRMGVGEGGLGRGKVRARSEEEERGLVGEEARAL